MGREDDLRDQVRTEFERIVDTMFDGKKAPVARALDISPQMLNEYLNKRSTPRAAVLACACELWGLEFKIGNARMSAKKPGQPSVENATVRRKDPRHMEVTVAVDLSPPPRPIRSN